MQLKDILLLVLGALIGWVTSIGTHWISMKMTASSKRRNVARILISEVQFNDRRAKLSAKVEEQLSSGQGLKDEKGNPVNLDLSQTVMLPGSFSFSTFDATLERQAYLDPELLDSLHTFYRLLKQAEQFREAAATDNAPQRRAGFHKDMFSSAAEAAKVAREKNLLQRLEESTH